MMEGWEEWEKMVASTCASRTFVLTLSSFLPFFLS
jgi:hypothetical protein